MDSIMQRFLYAVLFLIATAGGEAEGLVGPIENPGMNAVADAGGAQAIGYHFEDHCTKPGPWVAEWIWSREGAPDRTWFRKEINLATAPKKATAWLTADKKYRLWINGRLASRGPVDIGADFLGITSGRWFYDQRDFTPFFRAGRNVIAVEVFRNWLGGSVVTRGQGFLFEGKLDNETVKSDASWREKAADGTYGWQLPEFDDSSWGSATEVKDVWGPLAASEIPPLMEVRYPVLRVEGLPANKTFSGDGSFKVVFDRVVSGFPQLTLKGGDGATIKIRASRNVEFKLGGGVENLEFPCMDAIEPAYTVELNNVREPVEILDASAVFTSQPVEYRGEFECGDEALNQVWKASRWAVQICLQTHHLDSPRRQEPLGDPGDYMIESMVNHYAFALPWLTRQDIRKFGWILKNERYHSFHVSYSLAWLQMLMDYYDYTGDASLVREMALYVHELLDTFSTWRGANGLISEAPDYMFMDWVNIHDDRNPSIQFACHHPPAVIGQGYLTAFYYHGLEMGERVASLTGDSARVEKYKTLRNEVSVAFNRELWNPTKGLYRDGKSYQTSVKPGRWLPADKDIETFSPHVNMLAVLYDLAPRQRQEKIVEKVMAEKPLNTQPWFMHWVFGALEHVGVFDKFGREQLHRWQIMPETQTFREKWDGGDLSHGWCSTPLVQMSAHILGVTPAAPGFETISIKPELCHLDWAKGKVPSPHGDVSVSWAIKSNKYTLDAGVPEGTKADVELPLSHFSEPVITADGTGTTSPVRVGPGQHHFEVTGDLK